MNIRRLTPSDAAEYRRLRLYALEESPNSFGGTLEETINQSVEDFAKRIRSDSGEGSFILGAFNAHPKLIGVVGLHRDPGVKRRHKASVWGMYIAPSARGMGLGKALMNCLMEETRRIPGLELLVLTVVTDNRKALSLYESLGFKVWGTEAKALKFNGTYFDEFYMSVEL